MKKLSFSVLLLFMTFSCKAQEKVEKIIFSTEGYSGSSDYQLIIYSDRTVILNAISDNYAVRTGGSIAPFGVDSNGFNIRETEIRGIHRSQIGEKAFRKLLDLLSQLEDEFTQKEFPVTSLHPSSGVLEVLYNNGERKVIDDKGLDGSRDLNRLYYFLDELKYKQDWK